MLDIGKIKAKVFSKKNIIYTLSQPLPEKLLRIFPLDSYTLALAFFSKKRRDVLDSIEVFYPVDSAVTWLMRFMDRYNAVAKVYPSILMIDLFKYISKNKDYIFIIGGDHEGLTKFISNIKRLIPDLAIKGTISSERAVKNISETIEVIQKVSPFALVFVESIEPLFDLVIASKEYFSNVSVIIDITDAYKVYTDIIRVQPKWSERIILNTAYQVFQKPYLIFLLPVKLFFFLYACICKLRK
ncbi:WecB/TagA/CpsF family glycosyltransferase [Spirochaetota bacterium]